MKRTAVSVVLGVALCACGTVSVQPPPGDTGHKSDQGQDSSMLKDSAPVDAQEDVMEDKGVPKHVVEDKGASTEDEGPGEVADVTVPDEGGTDAQPRCADGEACDDKNACTVNDRCVDGKCVGGEDLDCDDHNPCTNDSCDPEKGCVNEPADGIACNDGDACTTGDTCVDGQCTGGKPLDCDDHNPCTKDDCDQTEGCVYKNVPDGAQCDDKNPCTDSDQCTNGVCKGVGLDCDDGNPCTDDTCDPVSQKCVHTNNSEPCDDGNACTAGDVCKDGKCIGGTPMTCKPDGNPCTKDECDPKIGCVYNPLPDGTQCDDGNKCTTGESCWKGKCFGVIVVCTDKNPCTVDKCDPQEGCVYYPVEDGTKCDDNNKCTSGDYCKSGKCVGGTDLNCDDGNACTKDYCDPGSGCVHPNVPDGTQCDDNNWCTTADKCTNGVCKGIPTC